MHFRVSGIQGMGGNSKKTLAFFFRNNEKLRDGLIWPSAFSFCRHSLPSEIYASIYSLRERERERERSLCPGLSVTRFCVKDDDWNFFTYSGLFFTW